MVKKLGDYFVIKRKEFLWISLRTSFYSMIVLFLVFTVLRNTHVLIGYFGLILDLVFFVSIFYTFVSSILHLNEYKEKTFAVITLIISTLLLLGLSLYITTILIRNIYFV